jgi:hypothetical protein
VPSVLGSFEPRLASPRICGVRVGLLQRAVAEVMEDGEHGRRVERSVAAIAVECWVAGSGSLRAGWRVTIGVLSTWPGPMKTAGGSCGVGHLICTALGRQGGQRAPVCQRPLAWLLLPVPGARRAFQRPQARAAPHDQARRQQPPSPKSLKPPAIATGTYTGVQILTAVEHCVCDPFGYWYEIGTKRTTAPAKS